MTEDLLQLYQDVIMDHSRNPQNFRCLDKPCAVACGHNALCGDKLTLYLSCEEGKIKDISFEGAGCAISIASASAMTELVKGQPEEEARKILEIFHGIATGNSTDAKEYSGEPLIEAFSNVHRFPVRVKCATLAWQTLKSALGEGCCSKKNNSKI